MSGEFIAFLLLALVAISGGVFLLNLQNVVHMVVALIFTFIAIAGIYVTLSAEFVAVVQVLIYSGAITIIMLFGIMLTRHQDQEGRKAPRLKTWLIGVSILIFFLVFYGKIKNLNLPAQDVGLHIDNTRKIGTEIYSKYVIPFELTSVLLLVALIGAVVLAKKDEDKEAETK